MDLCAMESKARLRLYGDADRIDILLLQSSFKD